MSNYKVYLLFFLVMANIAKLEFVALDISGKNYPSWKLDAEIHLDAKGLGNTIKNGNEASIQDKAKAMIFLRHHLHESLKAEYLTVKNPQELWINLKDRFDHLKTVMLPKARYDWIHLRLQDFKSVSDYNSAVFKIVSELKMCGEKITDDDMLEKTFSTFHATNVLLQQQYREKGFKKYSELISCLLVAEQNNELLLKNHEARPTGSAPSPEVNWANHGKYERGQSYGRGRGGGRGRNHNNFSRGPYHKSFSHSNKWNNNKQAKENGAANPPKHMVSFCHRCGSKGHFSRTCRTPKHLVELYQYSIKNKDKNIDTNVTLAIDDIEANHTEGKTAPNEDFFDDLENILDIGGDNGNGHLDASDFHEEHI